MLRDIGPAEEVKRSIFRGDNKKNLLPLVVARTLDYTPHALPKLNRAQHIVGRRAG